MDVRPNVGQLEGGPEAAVSNDERRGYITPQIFHNQFWLDHVQIGKACRIAVDTAVCAAVLEPNPEGLESYINSTFNISDQQKKNIEQFSISRQGKTCRLILSCRVIKALRLAPINATENSNPYIILGVIPSRCIGDKVTKHGLLREGQEDGLVGTIFRSRTQLSTLQPSWNEQFDIPLQDRDNDTLVIEMWSSKEPAVPNISQVKDQKGIAKFFGNHKSNDSLIGRTYCDAKGVHLIGNEMSLDLIEAFDRHKCGSIIIHLSIRVKSEHHTEVLMDESHGLLYKALVMKESEQLSKCRQEKFPSILSNHGEDLLHLHASYNGLSKLHEYSVRLSALLSYHKTCPFLPSVFKPIVDTLIVEYHLFCEDKLVVENHNSECQSAWINEILNQFQALLDESKKVLCDHLTMIDLSNAPGLQVLEDYVLHYKQQQKSLQLWNYWISRPLYCSCTCYSY